jgi:hypothetical protein
VPCAYNPDRRQETATSSFYKTSANKFGTEPSTPLQSALAFRNAIKKKTKNPQHFQSTTYKISYWGTHQRLVNADDVQLVTGQQAYYK